MQDLVRHFLGDRAAATSIEYALIATVVSMVAIGGFIVLAQDVQENYSEQGVAVDAAWRQFR